MNYTIENTKAGKAITVIRTVITWLLVLTAGILTSCRQSDAQSVEAFRQQAEIVTRFARENDLNLIAVVNLNGVEGYMKQSVGIGGISGTFVLTNGKGTPFVIPSQKPEPEN